MIYSQQEEIELRDWQTENGRPSTALVRVEEVFTILERYRNYDNVLDLGCGGGQLLNWFMGGYVNERVVGVDFSSKTTDWAKARVTQAEIYTSDILDFLKKQEDNFFDLIISIGVIQHIPEKEKVMQIYNQMSRASSKYILVANYSCNKANEEKEEFINIPNYKDGSKQLFARRQGKELFEKELLLGTGEKFKTKELITTDKNYANIILLEKKSE